MKEDALAPPAGGNNHFGRACEALVGAIQYFTRPVYRAELFKRAAVVAAGLTVADLDAGLRALLDAGRLTARQVNGMTVYHTPGFWRCAGEQPFLILPPAFRPNICIRHSTPVLWQDADRTRTLATCDARAWCKAVEVVLYDEERRMFSGTGPTARAAYRAAWRAMRLSSHTVPSLRRQSDALKAQVAVLQQRLAAVQQQATAERQNALDAIADAAALRDGMNALRAALNAAGYSGNLLDAVNTLIQRAQAGNADVVQVSAHPHDALTLALFRRWWQRAQAEERERLAEAVCKDLAEPEWHKRSWHWQSVVRAAGKVGLTPAEASGAGR